MMMELIRIMMLRIYLLIIIFLLVHLELFSVHGGKLCPRKCSCLGPMIDCSRRKLERVPSDLNEFPWVTMLDLSGNQISTLDDNAMRRLSKIEQLQLSGNRFQTFNGSAIAHMQNLTKLKLNSNQLREFPSLQAHPRLTHLILHHNQVSKLDAEVFSRLSSLRTLELSFNRFTTIKTEWFPQGTSVENLNLNNNNIVHLDKDAFQNLTRLTNLKLSRNLIVDLTKELFSKLRSLRSLDLSRNKIQTVQSLQFEGLSSLEKLRLKRNNISKLMDGAFYSLGKIQELHLDMNNISDISKKWLYGLSSLQTLSLSNNRISYVEPEVWQFAKNLQTLDLTHNYLTKIPYGTFMGLTLLRNLYLDHNRINSIDSNAFQGLQNLENLGMNFNEISWDMEDFSTNNVFAGLRSLSRLSLDNNRIRTIVKRSFSGLQHLKKLYLTDNAIASIQSDAFEELRYLKDLRMNSTNLRCDCQLAWLPNWLQQNGFENSVTAKCEQPAWLRGRSVLSLTPDQFVCSDSPKPVLVEEPNATVLALKGDDLSMSCTVISSSDSSMRFVWRKDNRKLPEALHQSNAINLGNTQMIHFKSELTLKNLKDTDSGKYQCTISNEFGSVSSVESDVTVGVFPRFNKRPSNEVVKVGGEARLSCCALGQPNPKIGLQKDGGENRFPAARERRLHIEPNTCDFVIYAVQPKDQGVYSCTASNIYGRIQANATLTVREPPRFEKPMAERQNVIEGETAVLECHAVGSPTPSVRWFRDSTEIKFKSGHSKDSRYFSTAKNQVLVIIQVRVNDSGRYRCQIHNTLGVQTDETLLIVKRPSPPPRPTNSPEQSDNSQTTTGIVIIGVVCCVIFTSLVWVLIIYKTRQRNKRLSASDDDDFSDANPADEHRLMLPLSQSYSIPRSGARLNSDANTLSRDVYSFPANLTEESLASGKLSSAPTQSTALSSAYMIASALGSGLYSSKIASQADFSELLQQQQQPQHPPSPPVTHTTISSRLNSIGGSSERSNLLQPEVSVISNPSRQGGRLKSMPNIAKACAIVPPTSYSGQLRHQQLVSARQIQQPNRLSPRHGLMSKPLTNRRLSSAEKQPAYPPSLYTFSTADDDDETPPPGHSYGQYQPPSPPPHPVPIHEVFRPSALGSSKPHSMLGSKLGSLPRRHPGAAPFTRGDVIHSSLRQQGFRRRALHSSQPRLARRQNSAQPYCIPKVPARGDSLKHSIAPAASTDALSSIVHNSLESLRDEDDETFLPVADSPHGNVRPSHTHTEAEKESTDHPHQTQAATGCSDNLTRLEQFESEEPILLSQHLTAPLPKMPSSDSADQGSSQSRDKPTLVTRVSQQRQPSPQQRLLNQSKPVVSRDRVVKNMYVPDVVPSSAVPMCHSSYNNAQPNVHDDSNNFKADVSASTTSFNRYANSAL